MAVAIAFAASPASAQLGADAQKTFNDYQRLGPHRAFALAADGKGYLWAGSNGADAGRAVESVLKAACAGRARSACTLYAVNNLVLDGRDWKSGAPVDGVISVAAAHHGYVKDMRDISRARSEWQQIVRGIRPGPRLVVVNFAGDDYDVGGCMDDARAAFAAKGVQALVIADPPDFKGHGAANDNAFPRKYGTCINAFIETGARQAPCE